MIATNTVYYSIHYNPLDHNNYSEENILSTIRKAFFESGVRQKNKLSIKNNNGTVRYSYVLQANSPLKWKKMLDDKIIEKSSPTDTGYDIISYNNGHNIFKISSFDFTHNWIETKYFSQTIKRIPIAIIKHTEDSISIVEYDESSQTYKTLELISINPNETATLPSAQCKVTCSTNQGDLLFYNSIDVPKESAPLVEEKPLSLNNRSIYNTLSDNTSTDGLGFSFYDRGSVSYVGNYTQGKKNGLGVSFKYDGSLLHIGSWKNGVPPKLCSIFDQKGDLVFSGKIKNNKRQGLGISYCSEKDEITVSQWKDGKLVRITAILDSKGNMISPSMPV